MSESAIMAWLGPRPYLAVDDAADVARIYAEVPGEFCLGPSDPGRVLNDLYLSQGQFCLGPTLAPVTRAIPDLVDPVVPGLGSPVDVFGPPVVEESTGAVQSVHAARPLAGMRFKHQVMDETGLGLSARSFQDHAMPAVSTGGLRAQHKRFGAQTPSVSQPTDVTAMTGLVEALPAWDGLPAIRWDAFHDAHHIKGGWSK